MSDVHFRKRAATPSISDTEISSAKRGCKSANIHTSLASLTVDTLHPLDTSTSTRLLEPASSLLPVLKTNTIKSTFIPIYAKITTGYDSHKLGYIISENIMNQCSENWTSAITAIIESYLITVPTIGIVTTIIYRKWSQYQIYGTQVNEVILTTMVYGGSSEIINLIGSMSVHKTLPCKSKEEQDSKVYQTSKERILKEIDDCRNQYYKSLLETSQHSFVLNGWHLKLITTDTMIQVPFMKDIVFQLLTNQNDCIIQYSHDFLQHGSPSIKSELHHELSTLSVATDENDQNSKNGWYKTSLFASVFFRNLQLILIMIKNIEENDTYKLDARRLNLVSNTSDITFISGSYEKALLGIAGSPAS
jgi:hypothetical protein